jgi:hypothetical protein
MSCPPSALRGTDRSVIHEGIPHVARALGVRSLGRVSGIADPTVSVASSRHAAAADGRGRGWVRVRARRGLETRVHECRCVVDARPRLDGSPKPSTRAVAGKRHARRSCGGVVAWRATAAGRRRRRVRPRTVARALSVEPRSRRTDLRTARTARCRRTRAATRHRRRTRPPRARWRPRVRCRWPRTRALLRCRRRRRERSAHRSRVPAARTPASSCASPRTCSPPPGTRWSSIR